jgi:hypothetical protein
MGVVRMFERPVAAQGVLTTELPISSQNDNGGVEAKTAGPAEVLSLPINNKIAHGVGPNPVFRQVEAALIAHGVDLSDEKIRSDHKIVTFLIQGMLDRSKGKTSDRCYLLDTLRHLFKYEEPLKGDTQELFGDLLGRLD